MFVRSFLTMLCLCIAAFAHAGDGKQGKKIEAGKFYKAKQAIRYCYLQATSHSISGDMSAYSEIIEVDVTNWDTQKLEAIFQFEEQLATDHPSQVFVPTFSWLSGFYSSREEASSQRDAMLLSMRSAGLKVSTTLDGKY